MAIGERKRTKSSQRSEKSVPCLERKQDGMKERRKKGTSALDLGSEDCTHSPVATRCAIVMAGTEV